MAKTLGLIITFYNKENFVFQTLKSLSDQSDNFDEILLVDDCSTDSTLLLLRQHSNFLRLTNATILKTYKNSGPGYARNLGINSSTSDYLFILDGDDYLINPQFVQILKRIIWNYSPHLVSFKIFDEKHKSARPKTVLKHLEILSNNLYKILNWEEYFTISTLFVSGSCFVYNRKYFSELRYSEGSFHFEDWEFVFKIASGSWNNHFLIDEVLVNYTFDKKSLSRSSRSFFNPPNGILDGNYSDLVRLKVFMIWFKANLNILNFPVMIIYLISGLFRYRLYRVFFSFLIRLFNNKLM